METNNPIKHQVSLPELLSYSTVQINTISTNGNGSGTGFIVNFSESTTNNYPMLVTNKHVLDGAEKIVLFFTTRGADGLPSHELYRYETLINDLWVIKHPVNADDGDVCVFPIGRIYQDAYKAGKTLMTFPLRVCDVNRDPLASSAAPLSQLIMIGYPAGMRDVVNNQPIFRTGIAATNPRLDFDGKKLFFVDMPVFPGSSGSPVLLYNDGSILNPYNHSICIDAQPRYVLLGLVSKQYRSFDNVKYTNPAIASNPILNATVNVPLNLGLVVKAERILELQTIFIEELLRNGH